MPKTRVVGIDPGIKRIGVAVVQGSNVRLTTIKDVGFEQSAVNVAAKEIIEWAKPAKNTLFIVEAPAPRYYGRDNSVSLIRLWWQIIGIVTSLLLANCNVLVQDSFDWNIGKKGRQRTDQQKKKVFDELFPKAERSNKDNRDAALMAHWIQSTL